MKKKGGGGTANSMLQKSAYLHTTTLYLLQDLRHSWIWGSRCGRLVSLAESCSRPGERILSLSFHMHHMRCKFLSLGVLFGGLCLRFSRLSDARKKHWERCWGCFFLRMETRALGEKEREVLLLLVEKMGVKEILKTLVLIDMVVGMKSCVPGWC